MCDQLSKVKFISDKIKQSSDELKQNVVKFIEGDDIWHKEVSDIMKQIKSSLQYNVRDYVKEQMTRLQKNPLLEGIEDKVKQYGDKLIEDAIKEQLKFKKNLFY